MKKYVFESLKFFCAAILCTILSAFATPAHAALPTGYTELQYIESTGTQYIDTLLPVKSNTLPEVIYQQTSCSGTGSVFGQVGGSITNLLAYRTHSSDNVFWFARLNPVACDTSKHTVVFNSDGKLYKDGTAIGTRGEFGSGSSLPMLLFAISSDNNTIKYGTVKIFSFKVKEGDTLVANLVPAKYGDTIGMYDTVNNRFYENAGSGSFIAGPIACDGTVVNYVSATGTGVQNGTPTPTNPIDPVFYQQGNMVLRKVGDYADSYDATTGKITRRVGVKVLDGTEGFSTSTTYGKACLLQSVAGAWGANKDIAPICTHFLGEPKTTVYRPDYTCFFNDSGHLYFRLEDNTVATFKAWLAQQYAAGTPVTIYYPLAEETTEDWPASYCETPIKIATTKYNESAFSPLNTALANAISVVDTVVSNTITQAGRIATLQAQKQTRPADDPSDANNAENCPAGKKCLLVTDTSGIPHWYEIVERYSRLPDGYTELQWIESTGTQYIDTGIVPNPTQFGANVKFKFDGLPDIAQFVVGSSNLSSPELWNTVMYNQGNISIQYQKNNSVTYSGVPFTTDLLDMSYDISGNTITTNINSVSQTGTCDTYDTNTSSIYLFARHDTNRVQYGSVKIYKASITSNGSIVRDFIPAKRNSDNVLGMYDTVNNRFYTNAGTGEFIAGDPVVE